VERGARHQQLARVQRLRPQEGRRRFRLALEVNRAVVLAPPQHQLEGQQAAHRLHHLNEANAQEDQADALSPEQPPALQAHLSEHQCNLSVRRRHPLNKVGSKEAGSARLPNLDRPVAPRRLQRKGAVKLSELSVAGHRRQRVVPVRVSVAAAQSKDNRPTVSLARHLAVQAPARREAEKSVGNLAPINLQPRRLPVRVRAKREADEREGKGPMVNLPASQKAERQLRLSKGRGNRSTERKRARGLHRRGHNYLVNFRGGSGPKFRGRFC
jgi:hypothetical protein